MARQLAEKGFAASALVGGWEAWRAEYPVESVVATGLLRAAGPLA